jgi:GNAT superfamily N-acetyltransferase
MPVPTLSVRPIYDRDLNAVLYVDTQYSPIPVRENPRFDRHRILDGLVAVNSNGRTVAYCLFQHYKKFVRLLSFATHPKSQKRGVMTAVLNRLVEVVREHKCHGIYLEVPETADGLHKWLSARRWKALKIIYHNDRPDGYLFYRDAHEPVLQDQSEDARGQGEEG